jgi:hypothetical protein
MMMIHNDAIPSAEKVDLYKLLAFLREFLFAPIFLICGILYIYNLFSLS